MILNQEGESEKSIASREAMVKQAMRYWEANRAALTSRFPGQYLLIAGQDVKGVFPTRFEAVTRGCQIYSSDAFVVRFAETPDHQEAALIPSSVSEANG